MNVGKKSAHLWTLVKCLLTLSHGNADPERGFSLNKFLLDIHGSSIHNSTIESNRLVKDFLHHSGGTNNVEITKEMIISSRGARFRYEAYLQEKKRQEEELPKQIQNIAEEKEILDWNNKKIKEIEQVDTDIETLRIGVQVAEKSIEDGNEELSNCLKSKMLNRKDVQIV